MLCVLLTTWGEYCNNKKPFLPYQHLYRQVKSPDSKQEQKQCVDLMGYKVMLVTFIMLEPILNI